MQEKTTFQSPLTKTCTVCEGKGKIPNPNDGKKITCPICRGSGQEVKNPLDDIIEEED